MLYAGRLFIVGGYHRFGVGEVACASVERLDEECNKWEIMAPMEAHRARFGCGVIACGPTWAS
eukprot:5337283-Alexandrium_andersonii.AAC.1